MSPPPNVTIGERLEEARKRRNVTLREASEFTKIRSEYLAALEANTFEIPLPEIYIRGFLRNYARFLRLDPERLLQDYAALPRHRSARRSAVAVPAAAAEGAGASASPIPPPRGEPGEGPFRRRVPREPAARPSFDPVLATKVGLAVAGVLVVALLGWGLVSLLRPAPEPTPAPAATSTPAASTGTNAGTAVPAGPRRITLRATESVSVIVDALPAGPRLFEGTLARGEARQIEFTGEIAIRFTEGAHLRLERDGTVQSIDQAGPGIRRLR